MSTVTEVRHQAGGFELELSETMPPSISRQLSLARTAYSFLVVTQHHVNAWDFPPPADPSTTPHPLLSVARYTGVIRRTASRYRNLEGEGLLSLLGTQDEASGSGYGQWSSQMADHRVQNTAHWWASLITNGGTTTSLTDGSTLTFGEGHLRLGGTPSGTQRVLQGGLRTYRAILNEVCWQTGYVYRIDPNGTLHVGTAADMYGADPRVVIGKGLPGDDDPRWATVRATLDDWGESTDTYITGAVADAPGEMTFNGWAWTNAIAGTAHYRVPTKNFPHNPQLHVAAEGEETQTEWQNRTTWIVVDRNRLVYSATFDGALIPNQRLIPGEPMWLWDPEIGLEDPANVITYSGQAIRPQRVELAAYTWPIMQGMGVYILTRVGSGTTVLDLTPWTVMSDDPSISFELGRPVRPL